MHRKWASFLMAEIQSRHKKLWYKKKQRIGIWALRENSDGTNRLQCRVVQGIMLRKLCYERETLFEEKEGYKCTTG